MNLTDILNQYLELYHKALNIQACVFIINLGQYTKEGEPISIDEIKMIYQDFTNLYHKIRGLIIDSLIGDSPTKEVVENRIKLISIKLNGLDNKLFEDWDENENPVSMIDTSILLKYYNQEDADFIKTLLLNIDACISLANKLIQQSVEQVQSEYLSTDTQPQDSTDVLRLPETLNVPGASKYFQRCINEGWLEITPNGASWKKPGIRLAYVCNRIYKERGYQRPQKELMKFFNDFNLKANLTTVEYEPNNIPNKKWRAEIDEIIFFD